MRLYSREYLIRKAISDHAHGKTNGRELTLINRFKKIDPNIEDWSIIDGGLIIYFYDGVQKFYRNENGKIIKL